MPAVNEVIDNRSYGSTMERKTYGFSWDHMAWGWWWDPAVFTGGSTPCSGTLEVRKRSPDIMNPRDAAGWRNPSPLSGTRVLTEYFPVRWPAQHPPPPPVGWISQDTVTRGGFGGFVNGSQPLQPVMPDTSSLIGEVRTKALSKFKDVSIDLSVAFAERKATANLGVDTLKTLTKFWRNLRRRNPKASLDELGNLWLSYRYGWTPAVLDFYGALEALEKQDNGTYDRYRVTQRATASIPFRKEYSGTGSLQGGQGFYYAPSTYRSDGVVKAKCRLDACLSNASLLRLQEVGVTDPQTTAWELLPYSFVVDWFVGVGDYLSSVNALAAFEFKAESLTVYREWNTTIKFDGILAQKQEGKDFSRSVSFTPPSGSIRLKREPLNLTRFTDAVALLNGLMKGHRR